ncbi:MAG: TonB-dependent receptor [Caulobacteraceae bacterium]
MVTATRQVDTVNRVPLAVTAQTQKALDQQGIRTIGDLQGTVPGLRLTGQEASGVATVAIRGVRQTSATAATTGFYLDETAIQKRAAAGFGSQNGTPIPPLFDLDRVEVLRGPQGTLFGGGSEGGTIRYIQPQPSLTRFSSYARAQVSSTKGGDASYEGGVAVGGPIVQDKLGFRASLFARNTGGYIDLTDYRNGRVYDENANNGKVRMGRLALAWAPTTNSKLTFSYFASHDETDSVGNTYNLDMPGVLTVPSLCYDVAALSAQPVGSPGRVTPAAFAGGPSCNGRAGQPGIYVAPGYTVGPLDLQRFQSLVLGPSPTSTDLQIASLDGHWDLSDWLNLRSVTSYTQDLNKGQQPQAFQQPLVSYRAAGNATYVEPGRAPVIIPGGVTLNPNITSTPNGLGLGAYLEPSTRNRRYAFSQEVRLSSSTDRMISFVAGVYYANTRATVTQRAYDSDLGFIQMSGLSIQQRYGVPNPGFFASIYETDKDVEIAGFGEVTVKLGQHLRATGGVRATHITTSFVQTNYGPNGFTVAPSVADGSIIVGQITDDPITPKASLQYFITPNDLLYATAAKGFRAGGVNQVFSSAGQGQLFGQYGLTKAILPQTYGSDSVWSYEVGGKFRLWGGRAQLNAAAYRIDWSNVQTNVFIGGDGFVVNVPTARSQGVEGELQLRPLQALTLNAAVGYGEAKYTSTFKYAGARGLDLFAAQDGQLFAQPKWTVDLGARYDFSFNDVVKAYARVDYRWLSSFELAPPGSPAYTPDSSLVPAQKNINLRFGVEFKEFDINLFVNNLTDEDKGAFTGGRNTCTNADCSTFNSYNPVRTVAAPIPRQFGVQIAFRR